MWNNYFFQIQKKYNMRISTKKPFVVRFDGRKVTKNKNIDLLENYQGSFMDSLEKTAQYFSEKYHCFALFGSDEMNFIIPNPNLVIEDLEPNDKTTHSQELVALFSQYYFDYFNHFDVHQKIFWHGKCFSIPDEKILSYIKYRSGIIKNVLVTYFAKKNNVNTQVNLEDKEKLCEPLKGYEYFRTIKDGVLYYNGNKIDLKNFLESGEIKEIEQETVENNENLYKEVENIEIEFLDE